MTKPDPQEPGARPPRAERRRSVTRRDAPLTPAPLASASMAAALHARNVRRSVRLAHSSRECQMLARRGIVALAQAPRESLEDASPMPRQFSGRPQRPPQCRPAPAKSSASAVSLPADFSFTSPLPFPSATEIESGKASPPVEDPPAAGRARTALPEAVLQYRRPFFKSKLATHIQNRLRRDAGFTRSLLAYTALRQLRPSDVSIGEAEIRRYLRWDDVLKAKKTLREDGFLARRDPMLLERVYERCYGRLINITSADDPLLQRHPNQQIPAHLGNDGFVSGDADATPAHLSSPAGARRRRASLRPLASSARTAALSGVFRTFQSERELFEHNPVGAHLAEQANAILRDCFEPHDIDACVERDLEEGMTVDLLVETRLLNAPPAPGESFALSERVVGVMTYVFLRGYLWLEHVAVAAAFQRRGIGASCLNRLKEIGMRRGTCVLLFALTPARAFYERLGFQIATAFEFPAVREWEEALRDGLVDQPQRPGLFLFWQPPTSGRRRSARI